jgi:hypothetical protein
VRRGARRNIGWRKTRKQHAQAKRELHPKVARGDEASSGATCRNSGTDEEGAKPSAEGSRRNAIRAHRLTAEEAMTEQQRHEREDRDARRLGRSAKRCLLAELQRSLDEKKAHMQALLHQHEVVCTTQTKPT